jgi:BirA family biotin operon repressor/biotin-[acetyl-CoA-carboxylase] ligase
VGNLEADRIRESIDVSLSARLECLEVFQEIDSTNDYLLAQTRPTAGFCRVVLAESQTAGRGRRGRSWLSPRYSGIYLSVAYTFAKSPRHLSSLTLASGIAVASVLERLGARDVALKWPNDIIAGDAKVGGILVESVATRNGGATIVAGVGLNVDLSLADRGSRESIAREQATDLNSCTQTLPDNSTLSIALIEGLINGIIQYEAEGFSRFVEEWSRLDWLIGRQIHAEVDGEEVNGMANGIAEDGALMLDTKNGIQRVASGSVRLAR